MRWIRPFFEYRSPQGSRVVRIEQLKKLQLSLRLSPVLNWGGSYGPRSALNHLHDRMDRERKLALDVLDFIRFEASESEGRTLGSPLEIGGSEWEVVKAPGDGRFRPAQRPIGPVTEILDEVRTDSQHAHAHLTRSGSCSRSWTSARCSRP